MSYEDEDTCVSYEDEDTCLPTSHVLTLECLLLLECPLLYMCAASRAGVLCRWSYNNNVLYIIIYVQLVQYVLLRPGSPAIGPILMCYTLLFMYY